MAAYLGISLVSGILFGVLDSLVNANPLAVRLLEAYKPISKPSINILAGIIIDLIYGFVLAALFLLLYPSLPGDAGLVKGISFAVLVWFLRVVMQTASHWMMFKVPARTLLYTLVAGLGEMFILGGLYGLTLAPPV